MGDVAREVTGDAHILVPCSSAHPVGTEVGDGCFSAVISQGKAYWGANNGTSLKYVFNINLASSRVASVGAANAPRSWGALACAYFGQPATV